LNPGKSQEICIQNHQAIQKKLYNFNFDPFSPKSRKSRAYQNFCQQRHFQDSTSTDSPVGQTQFFQVSPNQLFRHFQLLILKILVGLIYQIQSKYLLPKKKGNLNFFSHLLNFMILRFKVVRVNPYYSAPSKIRFLEIFFRILNMFAIVSKLRKKNLFFDKTPKNSFLDP